MKRRLISTSVLLVCWLSTTGCATPDETTEPTRDVTRSRADGSQAESNILPVNASPVTGNLESPLTVTLLIDPLDPTVGSLLRRIARAREKLERTDSRIVYHFVPSPDRPGSEYTSHALAWASQQGAFIEVFRSLLERDEPLQRASTAERVRQIVDTVLADAGLSPPSDSWPSETTDVIAEDDRIAERTQFEATPVVLLNGRKMHAGHEVSDMTETLHQTDDALHRLKVRSAVSTRMLYRRSVQERFHESNEDSPNKSVRYIPVREGDPVLGDPGDQPVTIVVFFQYGHPYTEPLNDLIKAVLARHDYGVRVVLKPLPPTDSKPFAARTALAAAEIGKFDPVHRALMTRRAPLTSTDQVKSLASSVDVDPESLLDAYRSEEISHRLRLLDRRRRDYSNLPTVFLNGVHLDRVPSFVEFQQKISWHFDLSVPPRLQEENISLYRSTVHYLEEKYDY